MVDKNIKKQFFKGKAWGILTNIDLFDCNPKKIRNRKAIVAYAHKLCDLIEMKRFRKTVAVRFGAEPRVAGYSFAQLIETSLVSGHLAEDTNAAYIDIFSCKIYDPKVAEAFTKKHFGAKRVNSKYMVRRIEPYSKDELAEEVIQHDPSKWFFEGGQFLRHLEPVHLLRVGKKLLSKKTKYQQLDIYKTPTFGNMMVLDGMVQFTDAHEFTYHEMLSHPAMFVHPKPEHILIIGGGDGGIATELLKHKVVKRIDLCDIDADVCEVSKKYFPKIAKSLSNHKVHVYNEDGFRFLDERRDTYDLIIVDSSDPAGPAKTLFLKNFYQKVYNSLKKDGIAVHQCESMFIHADIIKRSLNSMKQIYPIVGYYYVSTPMYPTGLIGFAFASKKYHPLNDFNEAKASAFKGAFKYYSADIHKASFTLPEFARKLTE